jgi:hypothetical protein
MQRHGRPIDRLDHIQALAETTKRDDRIFEGAIPCLGRTVPGHRGTLPVLAVRLSHFQE